MGRVLSCQGHNKVSLIGARGSVELHPCPPPHMSLLQGTRAEPKEAQAAAAPLKNGVHYYGVHTCWYNVYRQYWTDRSLVQQCTEHGSDSLSLSGCHEHHWLQSSSFSEMARQDLPLHRPHSPTSASLHNVAHGVPLLKSAGLPIESATGASSRISSRPAHVLIYRGIYLLRAGCSLPVSTAVAPHFKLSPSTSCILQEIAAGTEQAFDYLPVQMPTNQHHYLDSSHRQICRELPPG